MCIVVWFGTVYVPEPDWIAAMCACLVWFGTAYVPEAIWIAALCACVVCLDPNVYLNLLGDVCSSAHTWFCLELRMYLNLSELLRCAHAWFGLDPNVYLNLSGLLRRSSLFTFCWNFRMSKILENAYANLKTGLILIAEKNRNLKKQKRQHSRRR